MIAKRESGRARRHGDILRILNNLKNVMIYGKIEINGCEKIVKRVVSFQNTYKGIGEAGSSRVQRQQINGHCIEP